jgi:hypothetical protein
MQLEATLNSYFLFPTIGNTNMADERTCEVGSTLALFKMGSYTVVGNRFSKNTQL